ncbi:MAG: hypothetical protein FWC47_05235 [Oscillospiraceae bacterium]|nr:hypothetical protein [Oscillospiraceae bacterium]
MSTKILKNCSLILSYDSLSDIGKLLKKSQKFGFINEDSTADELLAISTSIQTILASAIKEVRQDSSYLIMEG